VKADSAKRSAWDQKKLEAVLREMHAGKRPPPPSCIIHQHRQRHEPHEKVKDLSFVYFVLFVVARPRRMLHASAHEKVKDLSFVRVFRAVRGHPHLAMLVRNGTLHKRLL